MCFFSVFMLNAYFYTDQINTYELNFGQSIVFHIFNLSHHIDNKSSDDLEPRKILQSKDLFGGAERQKSTTER